MVADSRFGKLPKVPLRWAITIGVSSIMLMSGGIFYFTQFQAVQPSPEAAPRPLSASMVNALGRIEPENETIQVAAPATQGGASRITELLVKVGDRVQAGQVLAIAETRNRQQAALQEAKQQVGIAQARLAQVKAGARPGEIAARQATVRSLDAELSGEQATQQATITRLEAAFQNAQVEYNRNQMLAREGAIAASLLDSRRLALRTAQAELNAAQAALKRTQTTLQARVSEASATVEQVAAVRPTDIAVAQAEVAGAIATVNRLRADLELAYIRAPKPGRILRIHTYAGEVVGDRGIVELGQTDQMMVVAEVYESDIGKVRVGQTVTVTSPNNAFAGKLAGTVDRIGLQVAKRDVLDTDPTAATDVRVIEVHIRLNAAASQQVSGLTNLQVNVAVNL